MIRHRADPFEEEKVRSDSLLFLTAMRIGLGRTGLWLMTWAATATLALLAAMPWYQSLATATAHRYEPGSQVHSMDVNMRFDHRELLAGLGNWSSGSGALLAFMAVLLGIFAAGGWLQVILEATRGRSVRRFFYGGARYFLRFLRFWLLSMLVLGAARWFLFGWPFQKVVLGWICGLPASDWPHLQGFDSEASAVWIVWIQEGAFAVVFGLVLAWGIYTRTLVAVQNSRSVIATSLIAAGAMIRHPLATLRPLFLLFGLELLLIAIIGGITVSLLDDRLAEHASLATVIWTFVVGQMALMWREATRGAFYYSAVQISQDVIPESARSMPWESIGGPGGPQYPVGGDDDYIVQV